LNFDTLKSAYLGSRSAYTPTQWVRWFQSDPVEPIQWTVETGNHLILAYQITQAPEFGGNDQAAGLIAFQDCLLRQRTFLTTVNSLFLTNDSGLGATLELRFMNDPSTRIINCYLLLRLRSKLTLSDPQKIRLEFERILPDHYIFKSVPAGEVKNLLSLGERKVVDIRKDVNLIPVGGMYTTDQRLVAPPNLGEWDFKQRFYVPACHHLPVNEHNWNNLFKLLQEAADPIHLRISVASMPVFEIEKNLAMQYHRMLSETYRDRGVANQDIDSYLNAYGKYISCSNLFSLKMQVAAQDEVVAQSVAHAFCAEVSFGHPKNHLRCTPLSSSNPEQCRLEWEDCNHLIFEKADHEPITEDERVASFMERMPLLLEEGEVFTAFRLPIGQAGGLPGISTRPVKPFYQPSPRNRSDEEIYLGQITISSGSPTNAAGTLQYSIPVADLTKHGLIVGSTGSGKTNTTLTFVRELAEKGIPFLLIEPVKSEYFQELSAYFEAKGQTLKRFNFKRPFTKEGNCDRSFFRFNPLIPVPGISVYQHISYIKGCFTAAFPMHGIMPLILEECLAMLYRVNYRLTERDFFEPSRSPGYIYHSKEACIPGYNRTQSEALGYSLCLTELNTIIEKYINDKKLFPDERTRQDFGSYLHRRLIKLCKGVLGNALCPTIWVDKAGNEELISDTIGELFSQPTIIELEELADNDEKALMMAFLLTYLFEYRQTCRSLKQIELESNGDFLPSKHIHVTIIEEAHRLLSSGGVSSPSGGENGVSTQDSRSKSISLFIDMLAEIRAKGEGIFIVEQIPTKLVSDVIKNTNLKIMHRITSKDDRHYLGEAMNMNEQQKNYVTTLKTGDAIIFDEQLDKPIYVKMNRFL
jgi:hypothetical protein